MGSAVKIRTDYSAVELRRLARVSKDARQSSRLLSLAAVLDGMSRTDAARIGGMDRQTLRDPAVDGVVRWRRIDLQKVIKARFDVDYHERHVSTLLKKLGFSHMSARPRHPAQDAEIVEAYKKTSRAR